MKPVWAGIVLAFGSIEGGGGIRETSAKLLTLTAIEKTSEKK